MKVKNLLKLLKDEDPEADVFLVSEMDQDDYRDFSYASRVIGVTEIPIGYIYLTPDEIPL